MSLARPYILSIAGFDPSAGAGVLADIKTIEANGGYGLGVCTAITYQNDKEFVGLDWVKSEDIIQQIDILLKRFEIHVVKIGLIENLVVLNHILSYLKSQDSGLKTQDYIIWDPILKSSTGFDFHNIIDRELFISVCSKVDLITPNLPEMETLFGNKDYKKNAVLLSEQCAVLLKGGHTEEKEVKDLLFEHGKITGLSATRILNFDKHGTGCVLSSAIATHLAKGKSIEDACYEAKAYINKFITSAPGLLGYHY